MQLSKTRSHQPLRRTLVALGLGVGLCASAGAAEANWPTQPIRVLLPVAPGGTADASMRVIQAPLAKKLGQPIVIENRPGGAAVVATSAVVRADPDGYTLGLVSTPFAANPALMKDLPYDSRKDVTPVAFFWQTPLAWSVHPNTSYQQLQDVIQASKKDPRSVNYAVGGLGQASHFSIAALEQAADIQMNVVAYRGAGPALNDVLAGQVPLLVSTVGVAAPHAAEGKLRPLAVTSAERVARWPDVPTARELGFPDLVTGEWFGFVGPAGMSPAIVQKLNAAIREVLADPEVHKRLTEMDLDTQAMSPEEFGVYLHGQLDRVESLVRATGLKIE